MPDADHEHVQSIMPLILEVDRIALVAWCLMLK